MLIKCTYCTIPLARGISRSDELENVWRKRKDISAQTSKKLFLPGEWLRKRRNLEIKNTEHTFLELVQLDEVEGIDRLNFI
jgi:threonylcarbamoyladenosine tRNA methylthiotransferase MtaB